MTSAADTHGAVFERGSVVLLARVVDADGVAIQPGLVSTIHYSVSPVDCVGIATETPVPGHEMVPLTAGAVLFDSLQTGPIWTVDETGYNFRHELDVSVNDAFPNAGVAYQVRYELRPHTGQKTVFRFLLKAI